MATISKAILDLLTNPKTQNFAKSLKHADLPANWADDPEIVDLAAKAWQEAGTDSPFFRAWFGGSKFVDDAGKPKKFYHGYAAETPFDAFDTTKGKVPYAGAFLVDNFFDAASWAKANADGGKKPFVHGGYVKADRPVTLLSYKDADELVKNKYGSDISERMFGGYEITPDYLWNSLSDSVTFLPDADSANRAASEIGKQMGKKTFSYEEPYDRIIPTHFLYDLYGNPFSKYNDTTDLFSSWVNRLGLGEGVTFKQMQDITGQRDRYPDVMTFFKPENFKSTGNRGTFNPSDPNLYRTLAPLGVGTAAMAAALLGDGGEAEAAPRGKALQQGLSLMGLLDEAPAPKAVLPVPENIPLPELQGSPKQVAWANDIRGTLLPQLEADMARLKTARERMASEGKSAREVMADMLKEDAANGNYSPPLKTKLGYYLEKNYDKFLPEYIDTLRKNNSASFWINNRDNDKILSNFAYTWLRSPENFERWKKTIPAAAGIGALAASLLAGGDEAKAAAINAALADPASREKAAAAGLPYDPPPTEPVVSPIDILVAPVGAGAGITNKLLAMALEAPVALGLDAGLSALGRMFGGGDTKKPGGW